MRNKNKKEILTRENIKIDIKWLCHYKIKCLIIIFSVQLIILLLLSCFLFFDIVKAVKTLIALCIIVSFGISIMYVGCEITPLFKLLSELKNNSFQVKKDILFCIQKNDSKTSGLSWFVSKDLNHRLDKPYSLIFCSNDRYEVSKCKYYTWSANMQMTFEGIYHTSLQGDEFYLILVNKKIIMVYSTKLFELMD